MANMAFMLGRISKINLANYASLNFVFPFLKADRSRAFLAFLLATFSIALDHTAPWILKWVIEDLSEGRASNALKLIALGVVAILISGFLGYWQRLIMAGISRSFEAKLRDWLFVRLLAQPKSFFQKVPQGDLLQNLISDLERIQELVGPVLLHLYRTLLTLILSTILLWLLSPTLGFIGLLFFITLAYASLKLIGRIYIGNKQTQKLQGNLAEVIRLLLNGITVVKASGNDQYFQDRLEQSSLHLKNKALEVSKHTAMVWPFITLLCGIGIAISLGYGTWLLSKNEITAATLAAVALYLVRAQFPLVGLGIMASLAQRGRASLDRIIDIKKQFNDVNSNPILSPTSSKMNFEIMELQNFTFSFSESKHAVLQNIDLQITPSKRIGIAGPTGSGKSLLAKIICGDISLQSGMSTGKISINQNDFSELQNHHYHGSWRKLFSYAPQDAFLFSWSILDNIRLDHSKKFDETIETAVKKSGLALDLQQFPHGYNSILGEKGVNLSGGQKQRLSLARAIWNQAPILILDDVISAVDPNTEKKIIDDLDQQKIAMIIVSHRYSILEHCNEILYLHEGKIIERGTHKELLELNGEYAKSWKIQMLQTGDL